MKKIKFNIYVAIVLILTLSSFKLMHTYYQQDNVQIDSRLTKTVNRTLPKVRFHSGTRMQRSSSTQHTLRPYAKMSG